MGRFIRALILTVAFLVIAFFLAWGGMAIWFRLDVGLAAKVLILMAFAVPGLFALFHLFTQKPNRALLVYLVAISAVFAWWYTVTPPPQADWAEDVSRQVTGTIEGDQLTLSDVREFEWRSNNDFDANWTNRTYDLSQLTGADMFLSYWGAPYMAHFIVSFAFADGEHLAWSVEVRREKDGSFSPVEDFFKKNTHVIVAAAETDVVGVRSNVRGEDVQLFRLHVSKDTARALLEEYVKDANRLAANPRWYNSLTTNCTTVVLKMLTALGLKVPLDYRLLANGYLPDYAYEEGILDKDFSIEELRSLGQIAERAKAAGLGENFSSAIRFGVPAPE